MESPGESEHDGRDEYGRVSIRLRGESVDIHWRDDVQEWSGEQAIAFAKRLQHAGRKAVETRDRGAVSSDLGWPERRIILLSSQDGRELEGVAFGPDSDPLFFSVSDLISWERSRGDWRRGWSRCFELLISPDRRSLEQIELGTLLFEATDRAELGRQLLAWARSNPAEAAELRDEVAMLEDLRRI